VSQLLELAQLVDEDRMTKMEIWSGRVESGLHSKRSPPCKLLTEVIFEKDLFGTPGNRRVRVVYRTHLWFP